MKNKIEISAAAGMVPSRGLRRRRVFGILSAMGLMSATALIGAERFSNSFVTVEGDGVRVADDGSIHFPNAKSSVAVEVTARPGWKVNGKKSLSLTRAPGDNRSLSVTSELGEDSDHVPLEDCQFDSVVSNAHIAPPAISIEASEGLIFMYAQPESNVLVSASASCETLSNGVHEVTTTWLPCPVCHAAHDPAEEKSLEDVAPGAQIWTASATGVETNSNTWTGYMTKGRGQQMSFRVVATNDCPKCVCKASTNVVVDVHELSIDLPDEFLGLNMTDEWKGKYVTRTASAIIDPEPAKAEYRWTNCGRCEIIGGATNAVVVYGATDQTGPSDAYRAEDLTVNATAFNEDGLSASATCTTNFTVVQVDIQLPDIGEEGDETARPSVEYVADNVDGGLSKTGLRSLYPVRVVCEPADVPGSVDLAISSGARLFEITSFEGDKPVAAVPAQSSYPCNEIGQKRFGIHGHSVSVLDVGEQMTAVHGLSGARDHARVKVVPPPPLTVSVQFVSPAEGGGWPYDPVWDDPEWYPTVNGSRAELCADDTDDALVIYTLSRDAAQVEGGVYEWGLFGDDKIMSLQVDPSEGVHTNCWFMTPDLKKGTYLAKIIAVDKETVKPPLEAKSNTGEVVRENYYTSDDALPIMVMRKEGVISKLSETLAKVEVSLAATSVFIPIMAKLPAVVGLVVSIPVNVAQGLLSIPPWMQAGTTIYAAFETVKRWEWNSSSSKYEVKKNSFFPGYDASPAVTHKSEFMIVYWAYFAPNTGPFESDSNQQEPVLSAFDDDEVDTQDTNPSVCGKLWASPVKWQWQRKPYGLLSPIYIYKECADE